MATYTYSVNSDYLDKDAYTKAFTERGNWIPYTTGPKVTFMYRDGKNLKNRSLEKINSQITNIVIKGKNGIYAKDQLYDIFMKYDKKLCEKYMMPQYNITINTYKKITSEMFGNKIWILKAVQSNSGKDVHVITKYSDYISFFNKKQILVEWVLVEYIDNPLLIFDRKAHFRINLLIHHEASFYQTRWEIMTAAAKYSQSDYQNKEIHDTHQSTSIPDLYYPDGFDIYKPEDLDNIKKQIIELFYHLSQMMQGMKCYSETKDCFEIFGVDVMITNDFKVKLIEINIKISRRTEPYWTELYMKGIMEAVIDPKFPPLNNIQPNNFFTKLPKSLENESKIKIGGYYEKYKKYKYKYISLD